MTFFRTAVVAGALAVAGVLSVAAPSCAQAVVAEIPAERPTAVSYGPQTVVRYRFGAKMTARGGSVQDVRLMVAVPLDCAEQEVELVDEDFSPHIGEVEYRQTDEGVRQMLIFVPTLSARQTAHAYATFEVRTRTILAPAETAGLAPPKRPDRPLKRYLGSSPLIDVNHGRIRAALKEATADLESASAWERAEAIYDYVLEHIKYEVGDDKSSVKALADGVGDCQAIGAAFVAMCRTDKIPARMVWVDGHQHAEFYLEDDAGQGDWYPIETAGSRAFGEMPLARVILQKGDNFRVPERRGDRLRYASDFAIFLAKPGEQPNIAYIRELVE